MFKLSEQAAGCIMMALQKGITEHCDISQLILGFELEESEIGLMVKNPPTFQIDFSDTEIQEDEDLDGLTGLGHE